MTEQTPEPTAEPIEEPQGDQTDWKAEARKWEQRAKENREAARQLEQQQRSAMTDHDRAIAEAKEAALAEARTTYGQRLARSEFLQAAARRNASYDAAAILDDLNLARYVGDDGEPDTKAIEKAVARLVPEFAPAPGLDLGPKPLANGGPNMTDLIRKAAGRA